jgi:hypothetical protein
MRTILVLLSLVAAGCAPNETSSGSPRSEVQRDVEGYAIASCLTNQAEPYLKDQGDAWASVIVQRMKGDLDPLANLAEEVRRENQTGNMAVIRDDSQPASGKALPLLHCGEIIDRPAVRDAIQKAIKQLAPAYEK